MAILAFDTSFGACSAAVRWQSAAGEWLIHEAYHEMATGHAEALMPMIEEVMAATALRFADVARIAVTNGPGSFTGVKIGVSAARGFRLATGATVVAVGSLAVIAHRADSLLPTAAPEIDRAGSRLAVCMDARGGNVFAQVFRAAADDPISQPMLIGVKELGSWLQSSPLGPRSVVAVGSSAAQLGEACRDIDPPMVVVALPGVLPHARSLIALAASSPLADFVSPIYLREPDARHLTGVP
jgi:tRNA threonylcarbamoyl adenosine modification protein YeaZ